MALRGAQRATAPIMGQRSYVADGLAETQADTTTIAAAPSTTGCWGTSDDDAPAAKLKWPGSTTGGLLFAAGQIDARCEGISPVDRGRVLVNLPVGSARPEWTSASGLSPRSPSAQAKSRAWTWPALSLSTCAFRLMAITTVGAPATATALTSSSRSRSAEVRDVTDLALRRARVPSCAWHRQLSAGTGWCWRQVPQFKRLISRWEGGSMEVWCMAEGPTSGDIVASCRGVLLCDIGIQ